MKNYKTRKISNQITNFYESYILGIVDEEFPVIRKRTYSNEYFLNNFKLMLNDINNWKALKNLKSYSEGIEFHYKYINKVFNLWKSKNEHITNYF